MIINNKADYDLDKLLNNYFVTFILVTANIILFLKFGEKFGDIFIDTSREVTVPLRILDGQIIYKDFHYEYGPFVPYFFAAICKIFGSDLESFRITGLAISSTISLLIFRFSNLYINRKYALLSSFVFIFVFAFHSDGGNIFNYIFPYSYTSIFGILFLLLLYNKVYNFVVDNKNTELIYLILIFSVCILTKLEIILSATTLIVLLPFIYSKKKLNDSSLNKKSELIFPEHVRYVVAFLCLIPVIIIYTYYTEIIKYVNNEILYLVKKNLNNPIGRGALGIDHLLFYLVRSIKSVLFFIFFGCVFFYFDKKTSINNSVSIYRLLLFIIILIISAYYIYAYGYSYLYFGTSIILLLFMFYLLSNVYYRNNNKNMKDKVMLITVISSLTLTFRMIFNNTVEFYGFYLLVPASICIIIAIFYYVPLVVRCRFKRRAGFFKSAFTVFFIIMCFSAYSNTAERAKYKNKLLKTNKGSLYVYDYQYFAVQSLIDDFKVKLKSDDTILVLPEGYMLNYFLDVIPTSFNNSHIPDLMEGDREAKLIEEIKFKKFDYIIIVPRYTAEWGMPVLGKDYLKNTIIYIYENYEAILLYGDIPFSDYNKFGILVLERK